MGGLDYAYIPTDSAATLTNGINYNVDPSLTYIIEIIVIH